MIVAEIKDSHLRSPGAAQPIPAGALMLPSGDRSAAASYTWGFYRLAIAAAVFMFSGG
jgi:hypothetical protein